MKFVLLTLMVLGILFCFSGCVTTEQQIRLNNMVAEEREKIEVLTAEISAAYFLIEKQTAEIKARIDAGSVTLDDGTKYITLLRSEMEASIDKVDRRIREVKESYRKEERRIVESGKSKVEVYGGIALAMVIEFLGINYYRSRKHPLTKEIA